MCVCFTVSYVKADAIKELLKKKSTTLLWGSLCVLLGILEIPLRSYFIFLNRFVMRESLCVLWGILDMNVRSYFPLVSCLIDAEIKKTMIITVQ